ncbi:DNA polymerase III subunit gamma/tau [Allohahella marinimesophila]|uniref:DNA polymerase III subunit gamma/tau n=2 Tax=Allohahella marinimesophila TaxID=1054972 RepID=A0ABP7PF46_9GAMM
MVGQEHVLQALSNALDSGRVHHAYLFTGTRGVGKTTVARIFARSLNCETGITSDPCGQCASCLEIIESRSVDLIEIDAASRTKVEDMRELLDNVQYAPSRNRFKIYLIDEVHMLSNHSFNALLKTLEEPPSHVKFLLATTDPQKLPVTILSRCLQFNLKNLSMDRISRHLSWVLEQEHVEFDEEACWDIARAAAGSMRDALSLTDQAIAYGDGRLSGAQVTTMLGTVDRNTVYALLQAVVDRQPVRLNAALESLAEANPDYGGLLSQLCEIFYQIALRQQLSVAGSQGKEAALFAGLSQQQAQWQQSLASQLNGADLQVLYQIALLGHRDLQIATDAQTAISMLMLRMLAFLGPAEPRGADAGGEAEAQKKTAESVAATPAPAPAVAETQSPNGQGLRAEEVSAAEAERLSAAQNGAQSTTEASPQAAPPAGTKPPSSAEDDVPPWVDDDFNSQFDDELTAENQNIAPASPPAVASPPVEVSEHQEVAAARSSQEVDPTKDSAVSAPSAPRKNGEAIDLGPMVSVFQSADENRAGEQISTSWPELYQRIGQYGLRGMGHSLAASLMLTGLTEQDDRLHFGFAMAENEAELFSDKHRQGLANALGVVTGKTVDIDVQPVASQQLIEGAGPLSPMAYQRYLHESRTELARSVLATAPGLGSLKSAFGASLIEDSVVYDLTKMDDGSRRINKE